MNKKIIQLIGSIMGFIAGLVLLFNLPKLGLIIWILTFILCSIKIEGEK